MLALAVGARACFRTDTVWQPAGDELLNGKWR
jgi:hypothetical protein